MTQRQTLDLLILLPALESWAFSSKTALPDYLHEHLAAAVSTLPEHLLEPPP